MKELSKQTKVMDRRNGINGIIVASTGYLVILFLPVLMGVLSEGLGLSASQVGQLASMESTGLALATLLCSFVIKSLNFHVTVMVGVAITVLANLFSIGVNDFSILCAIRLLSGFGEGLLVAVGMTAIGMTTNSGRWFGFYVASAVVLQTFGLLVIVPLYEQWQLPGIFILISILYLIPLAVLRLLPTNSGAYTVDCGGAKNNVQPTGFLILALVSSLFFYISIGGVWAYIIFMGTDAGLALGYTSQALAISMVAGLLGGVIFAAIGRHGTSHRLLGVSIVIMIGCLWLLSNISGDVNYVVILCVYCFFWSVISARLFAVISDADHSGRFISAAQTTLAAGFAAGPYLASLLVTDYGYPGINIMAAVALVVCFVTVTPLALFERQREAALPCVVSES